MCFSAEFPFASLTASIALAIGIGIQNAVSFRLRKDGFSRRKSFILASFKGMVELVAAMLGAAKAMSQEKGNKDLASLSLMLALHYDGIGCCSWLKL